MSTTATSGTTPRWTCVDDEGYWHAYGRAAARMDQDPATLTDEDLEALALTDPVKERRARALRTAALAVPAPKPAPAVKKNRNVEEIHTIYTRGKQHEWKGLSKDEYAALYSPVSFITLFSFEELLVEQFDAMNERNKERNEKIAALEAKVAALEARPELKYLGIWRDDTQYEPGSAVTHDGSIWIAKRLTGQRPNEDGAAIRDWQLAVKKGRDSRESRG